MSDLRHTLGRLGEDHAVAHLERLGLRVLARNFRTRHGELDVVCSDDARHQLVFCEVKTRRAGSGTDWDTMTAAKVRQVQKMALIWLRTVEDRPRGGSTRFDAIQVIIDARNRLVRLDHLEAAF